MLPSEAAAAYRACAPEQRGRAREQIAGSVRSYTLYWMRNTLFGRARSIDDLEDRVQLLAAKLTGLIVDSLVEVGGEDPYVARAARNAALDALRGRGDPRRHEVPHDAGAMSEIAGVDPFERRWEAAESSDRLARIEALLERAPAAYRDAIVRHYLGDESVASLVRRELEARGEAADDRAAWSRAENVVHQRISRAKRWLQTQVEREEAGVNGR